MNVAIINEFKLILGIIDKRTINKIRKILKKLEILNSDFAFPKA